MTKQTKIATKILERAYARELIKAAVGAAPGLSSPAAWGAKPSFANPPSIKPPELPSKLVSAFGQGTSDTFSGIGTGLVGLGNAALFGVADPIARAGQGLAYGNYKLTGKPEYANNAASRGALANSFGQNTRAGIYDAVEAFPRMVGHFRGEPTHVEMLRQQQGQTLDPTSRAYFNGANAVFDTATTAAATGPLFRGAATMFPRTTAGLTAASLTPAAIEAGKPLAQMAVNDWNKFQNGNQVQAAEPQPTQPVSTGVNYNQMAAGLNSGNPEMRDAANEFSASNRVNNGVNYNQMVDDLNNGQPEMQEAANEFAAENNADQTEVAQDAAATPAQPVEQPVPEQQSEMATDYAALSKPWALPADATPEQQQTVDTAQKQISAAPEPVKKAVGDLAADPTNAEAKAAVDAAATENIVKSVTDDPTATANGATDFGSRIGAQIDWYQKQDPTTQGLLALGLSAGVIGLISGLSGGGGLGSFLSMALGLGGAGLLGAATGAFGEDGQRAMGQGMASVGRMMGMNVPEQPQDVGRLIGENAPATIHAGVMNSAPTAEEKKQLFLDTTARANRANDVRAQLKDLDTVNQIAGMPEQAAVPLLMHLGQADKKPITADVAKQVYRNAVQTAQMASDKDSPMAKQIAIARQFAANPDKYVHQEARKAMGPAAGYVNKGVSLVNQLTGSLFGPPKQSPR